jgi:hypothetical protein
VLVMNVNVTVMNYDLNICSCTIRFFCGIIVMTSDKEV